jgi:hypothetical protein
MEPCPRLVPDLVREHRQMTMTGIVQVTRSKAANSSSISIRDIPVIHSKAT